MKRLMTSLLALMLIVGLSGCGDKVPEKSPIDILTQTRMVNSAFMGVNKNF